MLLSGLRDICHAQRHSDSLQMILSRLCMKKKGCAIQSKSQFTNTVFINRIIAIISVVVDTLLLVIINNDVIIVFINFIITTASATYL